MILTVTLFYPALLVAGVAQPHSEHLPPVAREVLHALSSSTKSKSKSSETSPIHKHIPEVARHSLRDVEEEDPSKIVKDSLALATSAGAKGGKKSGKRARKEAAASRSSKPRRRSSPAGPVRGKTPPARTPAEKAQRRRGRSRRKKERKQKARLQRCRQRVEQWKKKAAQSKPDRKCPKPRQTRTTYGYDRTRIADSLDEALTYFRDPILIKMLEDEAEESSEERKACSLLLLQKLLQLGIVNKTESAAAKKSLRLGKVDGKVDCRRLDFQTLPPPPPPHKGLRKEKTRRRAEDLNRCLLRRSRRRGSRHKLSKRRRVEAQRKTRLLREELSVADEALRVEELPPRNSSLPSSAYAKGRQRREAGSEELEYAPANEFHSPGKVLQCRRRGRPAKGHRVGAERWTMLCDSCWGIRRFRDGIYPRFVLDVLCDPRIEEEDRLCLASYGRCFTSNSRLSGVWVKEKGRSHSLSIVQRTACECRVLAASPLYDFISN